MNTKTANSRNVVNPQWGLASQPKRTYTADEVIDAYENGKIDGMRQYSETIKKTLKNNLKKAMPELEEFYREIPFNSTHFMMLQIADINYFQVIIAITKSILFDKDKARHIYDLASKVSKTHENLSISFIPFSGDDSINVSGLVADNYLFVYGN